MITYIIRSGSYYKIGKTDNLKHRLKQYDTHNPEYQMVIGIKGDCEGYLHKFFEQYHYKLEWFRLPDNWFELLQSSDYQEIASPPDSIEACLRRLSKDYRKEHKIELAKKKEIFWLPPVTNPN